MTPEEVHAEIVRAFTVFRDSIARRCDDLEDSKKTCATEDVIAKRQALREVEAILDAMIRPMEMK